MTNPNGRFGIHGGQYIPETLMNAVIELEEAYNHYKDDPEFNRELTELLNEYAGRPSRLYYAKKMTEDLGGAKIYLKREDLNHTGAHKINNVLGQALLAKKMGKTRLIAETGAGQHGVATATAAALMGMECVVFMGEEDTKRQALNVYRMRLLGAEVIPVTSGTGTLKDAVSEAMREWTSRISDTHYCLGSVMGIRASFSSKPQIEVTFDIDVNGVVKVSAKDLGTGREQNITITGSTNLSENEIQRAMADAAAYEAEDSRRKERLDLHNQAEVLAYKVDEALSKCKKELDKDEKNRIKTDLANLRRCLRKDKPEKMNENEEAALRQAKTQLEESANHLMVLYTSEQDGSDNGENNL